MTTEVLFGSSTDIGRRRENQEDSHFATPPVFAVADGMGGHAAGDVASEIAVAWLAKVTDADGLVKSVSAANSEIFERSSSDPSVSGMGTTCTAVFCGDSSVKIAHVGDSRAYIYRADALSQLTQDHTLVDRMVRRGEINADEAADHPHRSVLERALGVSADVEVDVENFDVQSGDRILLCTDGLTGHLSDDEIADFLSKKQDPQDAADALVRSAVEAGGFDNVTAVVIDFPHGMKSEVAQAPTSARSTIRRIPSRKVLVVSGVVFGVLALGVGVRAAVLSSWYVGAESGSVVVFRGHPGSVAGINLHKVEKRTDIEVEDLAPIDQKRVSEGIPAEDLRDALTILERIEPLPQGPFGQDQILDT